MCNLQKKETPFVNDAKKKSNKKKNAHEITADPSLRIWLSKL